MHSLRVLTVTNENQFLEQFRQRIQNQVNSAQALVAAGTIDEACSLLQAVKPRLIIVHWNRASGNFEQLDRLLWLTTVQARSVPVIVIADRYRVDQATTLYRLGVSEYLARTQHLEQIGPIIASYCQTSHSVPKPAGVFGSVASSVKTWSHAESPIAAAVQAV